MDYRDPGRRRTPSTCASTSTVGHTCSAVASVRGGGVSTPASRGGCPFRGERCGQLCRARGRDGNRLPTRRLPRTRRSRGRLDRRTWRVQRNAASTPGWLLRGVLRLQLGRCYRHERVAAEQRYVAKLKCLCKVGLGSVGVAATPAAEATASPGRAIERSGWPARTARSMPRVNRSGHLIGYRGRHPSHADVVVLEVNGIPGWQALQSVGDQDLTKLVVSACEALASRV